MPTNTIERLLAALLVLSGLGACRVTETVQVVQAQTSLPVTTLFDGFAYRGARPWSSASEHWYAAELPPKFEEGFAYVFWRKAPFDGFDFALQIFPSRLAALGFTIVSAPRANGEGFVFLDSGGPLYTIKARKNGCELTLTTMNRREGLWPWQRSDKGWPWQAPYWDSTTFVFGIQRTAATGVSGAAAGCP